MWLHTPSGPGNQQDHLNQPRKIEVEFHSTYFKKAILAQVFKYVLTKFQIQDGSLSLSRNSKLGATKMNWIQFYQNFCSFQFFFEILMDDIFVQADMRLDLPEKIETKRLVLQRLRYEDAEEIFYTYASKPEATRFMTWPTHQTIRDTRSFLKKAVQGWQSGVDYSFSIRERNSNRYLGGFGLINEAGKIQFGYILGPLHWGNGFATEACIKMMNLLSQLPVIYRVGTFVDAANIFSSRVLLKAGLEEEAKLSKWFKFVNQDNQPKDCILYKLPESFLEGAKAKRDAWES